MAKATVTKTVRLPADLAERLEAAARVTGTSENQVVVSALDLTFSKVTLRNQILAEIERSQG